MSSSAIVPTSEQIRRLIAERYPEISSQMHSVPLQRKLAFNGELTIGDAVVEVVTSQMLSRFVADRIFSRLVTAKEKLDLIGTWELPHEELITSGLSRSKAWTIQQFAATYRSEPDFIDDWKILEPHEMHRRVKSFWGMSDWTASILSIFYFGHEDVFPVNDGSIIRSLTKLGYSPESFDHHSAAPYRSYLALYLWAILDNNVEAT